MASNGEEGDSSSGGAVLSGDGRFAAFDSNASNLVPGDTNNQEDVFVRDRQTGTTERVSLASDGAQALDGRSRFSFISENGRFVAFSSEAENLVPGDNNGLEDVFVHDRETGETERVTVATDGTQANGASECPWVSADGRYVTFCSGASNLVSGDDNGEFDVFVRDRQTGTTVRASEAADGIDGNDSSGGNGVLTPDGRYVLFDSDASNLIEDDANDSDDVFLKDLLTGAVELISLDSSGQQANMGSGAERQSFGMDGRLVIFASDAQLAPGDDNEESDIYVRDRQLGTTSLVSIGEGGDTSDGRSDFAVISANGLVAAFRSQAENLVPDDTNGVNDVFVAEQELTISWGDHNCSGLVDAVDSLLTLRHDAGLGANTGDCPAFGDAVPAGGPQLVWGDVDCDGAIGAVDALKLLRHDAGLPVQQPEGCPEIGELLP